MSGGQSPSDGAKDGSDLRSFRTGGEIWYEEKLWRRWQEVKSSPDFIELCDKLKFDVDGFPLDFERLLDNPEVVDIMQRYGISWIPHYNDDRLTKIDMMELFGTCTQILCPPSSTNAVPEDFQNQFFKVSSQPIQDKSIKCFTDLSLVWNGSFNIRTTNQATQDEVIEEHEFSNCLLLAIDISQGVPEAQIAAEVMELVKDVRESVGIDSEIRGKESTGRKTRLSSQLIDELKSKRASGKSKKELVIEYWGQLASDGDRKSSPEEWGADIKSTTAYKTLQRYLK